MILCGTSFSRIWRAPQLRMSHHRAICSRHQQIQNQKAMDRRRRTRELSDDENNLQPPSKRVSRPRSPIASLSPNSITIKGTSDREPVLVGASVPHLEAAMQKLGDGLAVPLSREMDVLYDPLEFENRTRVSSQNEANTITEYDLPPLSQAVSRTYRCSDFLVLLLFTG